MGETFFVTPASSILTHFCGEKSPFSEKTSPFWGKKYLFLKIITLFFEKKSQGKVPRSSEKVPRSQDDIESPKILGQVPRSGNTGWKHLRIIMHKTFVGLG